MLIDLSDIIRDYGGKLVISEDFNMGEVEFMGEEFSFIDFCHIEGTIVNNTKSLELKAKVSGKAMVHCARCQKPIEIDASFPVSEILMREDAPVSEDDDVVTYSGNSVELSEAITNSFLMSLSGKYLCREDCKGLCPHCGTDLNEHECGCNRDIIDPRLEKLAEIMKNMADTE